MADPIPQHASAFPAPTLRYATPSAADSRWGKGFLAVCASFVLWGLGQWIAGYRRRGVLWLVAWGIVLTGQFASLTIPRMLPGAPVFGALELILCIALLIDAFLCGRRSDRPMLARPAGRYAAGVLIFLVGLGVRLAIARGGTALLHHAGTRTLLITTSAMRPTLEPGDRILTQRAHDLRRWDLVIFRPPGRTDLFTQRIAGLPGETIEIVDGFVHVNGLAVPSPARVGPYRSATPYGPQSGCEGHPIRLGPDEYFLLGDNSVFSYDCRSFPDPAPGHQIGAIPREAIVGRVTARYWPPRQIRQFK